ncbi:MAG: hypothetical protein QM743_12805 [Chitinophagaceae bacterium]
MRTKPVILKKIFRILLWGVGIILTLLVLAIALLVSPPGKRIVRDQLLSFLRKKLHTQVELTAIEYELPKMVGLKGVLLKDQQNDTLLSVGILKVDIDLLKLLNKKISVNDLVLEDAVINAHRNKPDTLYNFSYIIQAFAGSPDTAVTKKVDTSGSSFVFDVGTVRLNNIRINFADQTGGIDLHTQLKQLDIRMRELDPEKMIFRLKSLHADGLYARFAQDSSLIPPDSSASGKPVTLGLDELSLKNTDFAFSSIPTHTDFSIVLKAFAAKPEEIDLAQQRIRLDNLSLDQPQIRFVYKSQEKISSDSVAAADSAAAWNVTLGKLDINALAFHMDDLAQPKLKKGMDYAHLDIQNMHISAHDLKYSPSFISGVITRGMLSEQSGFQLQQLKTAFYYSDTGARLSGLLLQTPGTTLKQDIRIAYASLAQIKRRPDSLYVYVDLPSSKIDMQDVLLFAPQIDTMQQLRTLKKETVFLDAFWEGYLGALNLRRTRIMAGNNTLIDIQGRLDGLPDANRIRYALTVRELRSSRVDLSPFLPPASEKSFRLPDVFTLSGKVSGTAQDYFPDLYLRSSDGNAHVKGMLRMSGGKNREQYNLTLQTRGLNLGRLLRKDTLMGPITASVHIQGCSFDPSAMSAKVEGAIESALLKGYAYRDINFKGELKEQLGNLQLRANDPNVRLALNAHADLRKEFAAVYAQVNIDSIDFYAIKLAANPLQFQGNIRADMPVLNPDYPEGLVTIQNPVIATPGKVYTVDSLYIRSQPNADSGQHITVNFDFFQGYLTGKTPLRAIAPAITEHINRHYKNPGSDSGKVLAVRDTSVPQQYNLEFQASLFPTPFIQAFLPQLKELDTVHLNAALDQTALSLKADARRVVYGTQQLDGLTVDVSERDSAFTYAVLLDRFTQGSIQLLQTELKGRVDTNLITADVKTHDASGKERFKISANLYTRGKEQELSISPGLMLDYRNWSVAQPNKLVFGPEGMYAQNVTLSGNGARISLNSEQQDFKSPMQVQIANFNIADIMQMISGDTLFASGIIDGTATLRQLKPKTLFDADIKVSQLAFLNDTVGDLTLTAANNEAENINTKVVLSGRGNDLTAEGVYYPVLQNGNNFDLAVNIRSLNIQSLEGLAQHQIRESSGSVKGDLKLRGTAAAPLIEGSLSTQELQTTVTALQARFRMPSETIRFSSEGIRFDHFKILDSSGQCRFHRRIC